jgi:diguanylate cyclase (GGDEF)-like protein
MSEREQHPMKTAETLIDPVSPATDLSVLVAEDDPMFRRILKSWLENWGYRVILTEDGEKAWDILQQENQPEMLILDWVMPGIDGAELCHRVRQRQRTPYQYVLLVTAKDDSADVVAGLDAGADDYLTKPFDRRELRARLTVGRRILALQDGLIRAREELRFQATHDVLTGIWNRRATLDLLQREIERASRTQGSTGLLMLDLDHFKNVNDTYGHQAGDAVLREVARRVMQVIRSYDFLGRHGGEEFLVVLPGCDRTQVLHSAERICSAVAAAPVLADQDEIVVTTSIGATAVSGNACEKEILALADAALYQAKTEGRNRAVLL